MTFTTHTFVTRGEEKIFYFRWKSPLEIPKGIIQIAHGIGEHAGRYKRIAGILQKNGYEVFANDHRVHGKSSKSKELLGVYEGENYFNDAVFDMRVLSEIIKKKHPNQKIILFGHSMGSLLSRKYATEYGDDLKALILSGTASYTKGIGAFGLIGANLVSYIKGRKKSSDTLKNVFFSQFNKQFKPNRTKVDWISRDKKEVDLFDADPYRIEDFSTSIFIDLIKETKKLNSKTTFYTTPKDIPIYIFSGDKDPVGEMGKGVKKIALAYQKAGVENVTLKLYEGGRHEMLNEINKEEVEQDILTWLNKLV